MKPRVNNASQRFSLALIGLGIVAAFISGAYYFLQPRLGGDAAQKLGVPNTGDVRLITTVIEVGTEKLHYKWSFIGSSNWRKATSTATQFSLLQTYPLNSPTERGGCNVYEADLIADKASGKWQAILHGSDGTTVHTGGVLPHDKQLTETVQIKQTNTSTTVGTPANITLAQIQDKPFQISIAR